MAREIITNVLCDPCAAEDVQARGEEVTVAIGRSGPKIVALCDKHRKVYDDLAELILGHGVPVEKMDGKPPAVGRKALPPDLEGVTFTCSEPGCEYTSFSRKSVVSHARMHKTGAYAIPSEPLEHECPECDTSFSTPQGVGAHLWRAHGIPGRHSKPATKKGRAA